MSTAPAAVPARRAPVAPLAAGLAAALLLSLVCGVALGSAGLGWSQVLRLLGAFASLRVWAISASAFGAANYSAYHLHL